MIFYEVKTQPRRTYEKYLMAKFKEPIITNEYINEEDGRFMIDARDTLGFQSDGISKEAAIEKFNFDVIMLCDLLMNSEIILEEPFQNQRYSLLHYVDIKEFLENKKEYIDFIKVEKEKVDKEYEQWYYSLVLFFGGSSCLKNVFYVECLIIMITVYALNAMINI